MVDAVECSFGSGFRLVMNNGCDGGCHLVGGCRQGAIAIGRPLLKDCDRRELQVSQVLGIQFHGEMAGVVLVLIRAWWHGVIVITNSRGWY